MKDNSTKKVRNRRFGMPSTKLMLGMLVGLIAEIVFLGLVIALDVLPFAYVMAIVGALIVVDAIIMLLLGSKKKNTKKHLVGLIAIMLVIQVLLVGDIYVYSTYETLDKISKYKASFEIYNVVGLENGSYTTVDDLKGQEVATIDQDSKQLHEAEERLVTKADVQFVKKSNVIELSECLIDDGKEKDNLILISTPNYKMLGNEIENFTKQTKVIYRIKVKKRVDDNPNRIDVTSDSFNVLISGMDVYGTINQDALSDVNMVMTVNPKTKEILLTSIPRDSYVPFHMNGQKDKLTHTGIYGQDETRKTIEDLLDIKINYYIKVNFSMLKFIVRAIGGIDVYSDYAFKSSISDWEYKKGWNHLGGHSALYFARERKSFTDGDMQRNKHQQIVLKAIIDKVTNSKVLMTSYPSILAAVDDKMATDFTDKDLKKLAKLTISTMNVKWNVETVNIEGGTGMAPCFSMGMQELSCVFPTEESVNEAKTKIHDVMYPVKNDTKDKQQESTSETMPKGPIPKAEEVKE